MVQSLQLGNSNQSAEDKGMKRLNRLPLYFGIGLAVLFLAVLVYGLSSRGLHFGSQNPDEAGSNVPASNFAEQMKRGVTDGIIGDREDQPVYQPTPVTPTKIETKPVELQKQEQVRDERPPRMEFEEEWLARLRREQKEQLVREQQRQRMASMQARATALDSPLKVSISELEKVSNDSRATDRQSTATSNSTASDLYAAAMKSGLMGQNVDPNGQSSKEDFFNADIKELGYLPNRVVPQQSRFELKRGSVIPATMITGINSDLPGRITAQVSQSVYDSATGHYLLIPQGTKLLGRYDSKVSFGQSRVLVVWTDIIFPNGSTLQIGGMAGTDSGRLWRLCRQGRQSLSSNLRLGRARRPHRHGYRHGGSSKFDARNTGYRIRRRTTKFRGNIWPRCRTDDLEEPECPADHPYSARLSFQRAGRSGHGVSRKLFWLRQTLSPATAARLSVSMR